MARSLYGGRLGDTVVSLFAIGDRQVLALPTDANGEPVWTVLEVYDAPDGTHLTDLLAANGTTPITSIAVPTDGQIPAFYGPDGYGDGLYLRDPEGDYYRLDAKGAVGPAGPTGPAGGVSSVNGLTGAVTLPSASTTAQGIVELATNAETTTGTDTDRAVTPSGVKAVGDTKQPLDADLTAIAALTTTTYGRAFLALADAAAARSALTLGTAAVVNTGTTSGTVPLLGASGTLAVARLATGTPDGTKFVRDDGTLAVPAGGGGSSLLASTAYNPATVTSVTNATATFTDVDATNLVLPTFTHPASGAVIFVLTARVQASSATIPAIWGVGVAGTVVPASTARVSLGSPSALARVTHRVKITGLTPGATSSAYRWMHANAGTSTTTTTYGGTGVNAEGQALMEVWSA